MVRIQEEDEDAGVREDPAVRRVLRQSTERAAQ
jgi:hypothetical protein